MKSRFLVPLLTGLAAIALGRGVSAEEPARAKAPAYAVAWRFAAGGEGGWDYLSVDSAAKRLYVSRGTRVAVLDTETGKEVGEIPKTEGVHGIALAPELKRGFTSNGRSSTVTVFELGTLRILSEVKTTGENPDAILYEPVTKRVFTFNGRGANATAIDAASGEVLGTIPLGGKPEFAVSDPSGRVYLNIEDKNELAVLDPKKLAVEKRWPLATVPIGDGADGAAFDPGTGVAFSSNGEGTLTVVREDPPGTFSAVQSLATQKGARTVVLDEKTHRLFLPTAKFGPPPSPTAERPRPRPSLVPGSFEILVVAPR